MSAFTAVVAIILLIGLPRADPGPVDRPGAGQWPVAGSRMTAGFDPPAQDWLAGHRGVDFAALPGTPVRAVAAGVVAFAGPVAGRPVVVVRLPDGRRTTYEPVRALVGVGEQVAAGATLGVVVDRAGSDPDPAGGRHCASGCLHLGLRTATGYADPLSLLTRPPAVLKPL